MKQLTILLCLLLAGCGMGPKVEANPNAIYTQAAGTVQVQLTHSAALTPSITPTLTLAPTATITLTRAPTATFTPSPIPTATWIFHPAGNVTVPILAYQNVGEATPDSNNVPLDLFQQHLNLLKRTFYQAVTVNQVAAAIAKGANLPGRPVALTFDGMTSGIYQNAFPAMKKIGYVGTVYVIVNQLEQPGKLTRAQLKEMAAAGWEIGSQGVNAYNLTGHPEQLGNELGVSKQALEKELQVSVTTFAYPGSGVTTDIANSMPGYGYQGAVGMLQTYTQSSGSLFFLGRFPMKADQSIDTFINLLPWRPASL